MRPGDLDGAGYGQGATLEADRVPSSSLLLPGAHYGRGSLHQQAHVPPKLWEASHARQTSVNPGRPRVHQYTQVGARAEYL